MALTLTAKPSGSDYRYTYAPPLAEGDGLLSYTLVEAGCTILTDEANGDEIVFFVSGGTAGTTATIAVEALTNDGEALTETLYIPITSPANVLGNTVRDIVHYALRPIIGIDNDAAAPYADQALEAFNDLVAEWRIDGLDVGIPGASTLSTEIVVRDEFISALKFNLRVRIADEYGYQLPAATIQIAQRARLLVENVLFSPAELTFERALLNPQSAIGFDG